ncbi:MAG: hypothetical protein V1735_04960 [Nanoarchaeota archaeon]
MKTGAGIRLGYFVGIDESNHGRFPEVFVAVYSSHVPDIMADSYPKSRVPKPSSEILGARDFRHIIIPREIGDILQGNVAATELIVLSEFLSAREDVDSQARVSSRAACRLQEPEPLVAIKDGPLDTRVKDYLARAFPEVQVWAEAKADETFRIVNIADSLANQLYHYYSRRRHSRERTKYVSRLITPRIEEYMDILYALGLLKERVTCTEGAGASARSPS